MEAILVVDIDYADGWSNIRNNEEKIKISGLMRDFLGQARKEKKHIIFIAYPLNIKGQEMQLSRNFQEGSFEKFSGKVREIIESGGCIGCDITDKLAEFLEHRHVAEFEPVFLKAELNAFTNERLAQHLRNIGATELILLGCNTFECVLETAIGAVKAGFNTTLLKDFIYPPFDGFSTDTPEKWLKRVREKIPEPSISVQIK